MDNGYNIETCKIIGATSLRLHFLPYGIFFLAVHRGGGHGPSGPIVNTPLVVTLVLSCPVSEISQVFYFTQILWVFNLD